MTKRSLKEPDIEEYTPLDQEIFLLQAGLRTLVKKERIPTQRVDEIRERFEAQGLYTAYDEDKSYNFLLPDDLDYQTGTGAYTTLFLGLTPEAAQRGVELERYAYDRGGHSEADYIQSVKDIGKMLGYPDCCVEAYLYGLTRYSGHQNIGGFYLAAYHRTKGPFNPLLNPFSIGNPYIRHFPCTYNCEDSLVIARAVHAEIRRRNENEADKQLALFSRPTLFWHPNRLVALTGEWKEEVFRYTEHKYYDGDGYYPTVHWDEAYEPVNACLKRGDGIIPEIGAARILAGDEALGTIEDLDPLSLPYFFNWDDRWYPYENEPKVAMLDVHATTEDYFGSPPALLGGDLRKQGVHADLYFCETGHHDSPEVMDRLEKICKQVVDSGCQVVVAARCLSPRFFAMLGEHGLKRVIISAGGNEPEDAIDIVLDRVGDQRPGNFRGQGRAGNLRRLLGILEQECAPHRTPASSRPPIPQSAPIFSADLKQHALPFDPILEYTAVPGVPEAKLTRWYLHANEGCPYSKAFSDPDKDSYLPPEDERSQMSLRGCNFCDMGGDYKKVEWRAELGERMAEEITTVVSKSNSLRTFIIGDTYPFPYLPSLVETLIKNKVKNVEVLIQSRPDWFLKSHPRLTRLFPQLSELRTQLVLYLVGFENFSQAELDRMDKGMTVEQNLETIRVIRKLEDEFPRSFTGTRHKSHGFLLFNPWTTMDDLETNANIIREHDFHDFRSHFLLTRLRLYPHLPAYHKAKAEGLMIERYDRYEKSSSRRVGYAPEFPWKAKDPGTDIVFELVSSLHEEVAPQWHGDLLGWAVSFVREELESPQDPKDIEDRFRSLIFSEKLPKLKRGRGRLRQANEKIRASRKKGVRGHGSPMKALQSFGPLALKHELIKGWNIKSMRLGATGSKPGKDALKVEVQHHRANVQLVFTVGPPQKAEQSKQRRGGSPFDLGPIKVRYMKESELFRELMPAGKALKKLLEDALGDKDHFEAWEVWSGSASLEEVGSSS